MSDSLSVNTNFQNGFNFPLGNNFNFTSNSSNPLASGTKNNNSLFGPLQSSNTYSNDFMMSGFDFNSLSYDAKTGTIFQQKPVQDNKVQASVNQKNNAGVLNFLSEPLQQTGTSSLTGNVSSQEPNFSELNNYLTKQENAQQPTPSNIGKIAGAAVGFSAPIAERVVAGLKNGSVIKALNWKQLAVTCPIIALAGYGVGFLADKIINSVKGVKPQVQTTDTQQTNTQVQNTQTQQVPLQTQYKPLQIAA